MDLIEQYVQAVVSYLPNSLKNKASKLVKSQVEEGLPEDYTEMDIHNELQKLGSAQDFARLFRANQYLIGPSYYPQYLAFLQKLLPVAYLFFLFYNVIRTFFENHTDGFWLYMLNALFLQPINHSVQVVVVVTLIFIVLEKKGIPMPESILIIPKPKSEKKQRIPLKAKLGINAFLTVAFLFLMQFHSEIIAIYPQGESPIPIFIYERLNHYLPFIFLLGVVQLFFIFLELSTPNIGKWRTLGNMAYNLAILVFLVFFLTDRKLYTADFLALVSGYEILFIVPFLLVALTSCAADTIKGILKWKASVS